MATQKHLVTDKPCFYCPFRHCLPCKYQGGADYPTLEEAERVAIHERERLFGKFAGK